MGCFVHVILLGVGCFVSLQKNMWWFSSTYNKMDGGCFVRGVFCPTLKKIISQLCSVDVKPSTIKITLHDGIVPMVKASTSELWILNQVFPPV